MLQNRQDTLKIGHTPVNGGCSETRFGVVGRVLVIFS